MIESQERLCVLAAVWPNAKYFSIDHACDEKIGNGFANPDKDVYNFR